MYHRIIILALLFSISGESTPRNFLRSPMEISDALPVQFWLTGCATYNEHEAPGVHHKCYCAPWECDDQIKIQFTDDASQTFSLLVYDNMEQLLSVQDFDEIAVGVYEMTLILNEDSPDLCDQLIQLQIRRNAGQQGVTLPSLSTWANDGGSGDPWTTGSSPSIATTLGGTSSEILFVDFAFIAGVTYSITVTFTNTAGTAGLFTVRALDGSNVTQFSESTSGASSGVNVANVLTFTATASTTRIGISLTFSIANQTTTINSVTATRSIGTSEIVAKTDCLDIKQQHENSILLTYSNTRNFAGLIYENTSPETEFTIRIPAIFFHQRFPEEDEVMELSTSLATLNGVVRKQRLLDIDYIPYYFHEKLKLILKHQTLSVFSRRWVKQEAYEILEGDRRWPVKKAKCWLSEKDFVHRNIL